MTAILLSLLLHCSGKMIKVMSAPPKKLVIKTNRAVCTLLAKIGFLVVFLQFMVFP